MKKLLLFLVGVVLLSSSCKKDCPVVPEPVNLANTSFKGSSTINGIIYNPSVFSFIADGTMSITLGTYGPFKGFWSKLPNSNMVNFYFEEAPGTNWKAQCTINAANNKLEAGVITQTSPATYTGTFSADKL